MNMPEDIKKNNMASDVAVSCRVRLARNLSNTPFPARMDRADSSRVAQLVREAIKSSNDDILKNLIYVDMQKLNAIDRQLLFEKHLISLEFISEEPKEKAAFISKDEKVSIMVNEEDHLRLQCIYPGIQLGEAWELCTRLDGLLEEKLEFAFDPEFGYLTCCPTNIGTGIRASIMLHLPALAMTGYINEVLEACGKLGVAVRGIYGEKSEASGNMFQISNQVTLGQNEKEIIASVNNIAQQIIDQERVLRTKLYKQNPAKLEDRVYRSLGIFTNARILTSEECFKLLSDVRLGADMGIIKNIGSDVINELMLLLQPAHLQKIAGRVLGPEERDIARADFVRKRLEGLE